MSKFYNGAVPFLLVNDLRLLSKVEIEDFHNFAERGIVFEVEDLPDFDKKNIATAPLNRWREMRAVLSPAFTTKKLSQNQFTDKNVLKMQYMDSVLNESMRFYTGIVGFVTRRAAKTYEYEGVKIPKGLSVMVPVSYLHQDPEVWREPGNFDPERFSSENRSRIHPVSFQPFGKGPRECLGRNFALLEMKIMLAKFLANFKVSVDEEHHKELIKLGSTFIASVVPNGVWMKLEKVRA
ncbi:hypothetical protein V5799_005465 [Amblyomma americanum]|uniref:Cytochrome n=1 Tax=Amblyomma americanum TaxID=6943 RepID=A0AAQ4DZ63_AMBAM